MEAKRQEELNAAGHARGADDETKARCRGNLADFMVKVDRSGNLGEILDIPSDASESNGPGVASTTEEAKSNQTGSLVLAGATAFRRGGSDVVDDVDEADLSEGGLLRSLAASRNAFDDDEEDDSDFDDKDMANDGTPCASPQPNNA
ncbi:unnamed protein product, partial [Ectocarpus sp. 6 AP-2014]